MARNMKACSTGEGVEGEGEGAARGVEGPGRAWHLQQVVLQEWTYIHIQS